MSATELAASDVQRMPDLVDLITNEDGSINPSQSGGFLRAFIRDVVSPADQNAMFTADGGLSQAGLQRVRNAVFARAYGDSEIVAMMTESTDANVKNILAGMLRAAPAVARLGDLIQAGARYPLSLTRDLSAAVREFSSLRRDGRSVQQMLDQTTLFGDGPSPAIHDLLRGIEENARAPKRVAELVGRIVDRIDSLGDPRQVSMFEGTKTPTLQEIIASAVESVRKDFDVKPTGDLFSQQHMTPELEVAQQILRDNPDMRIPLEDGTDVSVREAVNRASGESNAADTEASAFGAAVTCFLRTI
jgi:hypothetical protein